MTLKYGYCKHTACCEPAQKSGLCKWHKNRQEPPRKETTQAPKFMKEDKRKLIENR